MSRVIKPDSGQSLVLQDEGGDAALTVAVDGQVTFSSNTLATQSEVFGTKTEGTISSGTTALTVASASGISNGDFVIGRGITQGTTVSSGGGTTSLTLSANANQTLSSEAVMFYTSTKLLNPGLVGGMLCRAWVNFNGTLATPAIRASGNVSSITDNGTGDYTVNFTTAMPDANYSVLAFAGFRNVITAIIRIYDSPGPSTTSVRFEVAENSTGNATDTSQFNLAIFR